MTPRSSLYTQYMSRFTKDISEMSWDKPFAADLTIIRFLSHEVMFVDDKHRTLSEGLPTEVSPMCVRAIMDTKIAALVECFSTEETDEFLACMN